jgi:hypothetical protein
MKQMDGKIKKEIGKLWKKEKEGKEYVEEREMGMIAAEENIEKVLNTDKKIKTGRKSKYDDFNYSDLEY